jgi:hypothetical protein
MRLPQLPLGARFEYQGERYTKTGPLTAAADQGGQRMIPRHAVLRPVGDMPAPAAPQAARQIDETRFTEAFAQFHATCRRLVDDFGQAELEAARQKFLAALAD